jgi:hypothetical protein
MSHDEVVQALGVAQAHATRGGPPYGDWLEARFRNPGITTYYADGLACVAIDARQGPQVTLDGTPLVGCVPSVVEQWLIDYTEPHGLDLIYSHEANPGSAAAGLVMRVQRAGDVVLTRPLFMRREWVERMWDCVPGSEWNTFA